LKILFVHPRLNVLGGAERVLVHILRALQENDLALITDRWNPKKIEKVFNIEQLDVKWIECPSFHRWSQHFTAFQWFRYTNRLNRFIREVCEDYDLLFETQQIYADPCPGMPLINYIHYPTLVASLPENQSTSSAIYYAILRALYCRRIKRISLALTNSTFTARKIAEYLKMESLVVPPPVDVKRFYSNRSWSDREDKVVTVGVFTPFKRQHLLLEVARQLPNVQFVIVGTISEDHRGYYEALCRQKLDNVTMKQDIAFEEELVSAKAYVHLCPEPFGISVVEAAAAGCVPIVYHIGGPAESLGDASLKWKDLKQLSTFIHEMIKNEDSWSQLSEKAKKKSLEFDTSIFETRIRNIVKEQLWKQT